MPRFASRPSPWHPRSTDARSRHSTGLSPLDWIDDLGTGFIGELLDLGQWSAETITEHALYYAGRKARRLGRAIARRFGDR